MLCRDDKENFLYCIQPTVIYVSEKLMVQGRYSFNGTGFFHCADDIREQTVYKNLLFQNLKSVLTCLK